jgi:hypothetical protein
VEKTIPLHLTLRAWAIKEVGMDEEPTRSPTWHVMYNVSWPTGFCAKPISNRWIYHKTGRPWHFKISQPLTYYCLFCEGAHVNRILIKYSLHPKMIILPPGILYPKVFVWQTLCNIKLWGVGQSFWDGGSSVQLRTWWRISLHYTWSPLTTQNSIQYSTVRPSDEFQGPSQRHNHSPWL